MFVATLLCTATHKYVAMLKWAPTKLSWAHTKIGHKHYIWANTYGHVRYSGGQHVATCKIFVCAHIWPWKHRQNSAFFGRPNTTNIQPTLSHTLPHLFTFVHTSPTPPTPIHKCPRSPKLFHAHLWAPNNCHGRTRNSLERTIVYDRPKNWQTSCAMGVHAILWVGLTTMLGAQCSATLPNGCPR